MRPVTTASTFTGNGGPARRGVAKLRRLISPNRIVAIVRTPGREVFIHYSFFLFCPKAGDGMNLPPVCQKEGRASGEQRPDLCPLSSGQYVPLLGQLIPLKKGQGSGRCSLPLQDSDQVC